MKLYNLGAIAGVLLAFVLAANIQHWHRIVGQLNKVAGGCVEETISDDFAADVTNWVGFGDSSGSCALSVENANDDLRLRSTEVSNCDNQTMYAQYNGATLAQSSDMWAKILMSAQSNGNTPTGICVRVGSADPNSARYCFYANAGSTPVNWLNVTGMTEIAEIDECNAPNLNIGTILAVYVQGTGTSTQAAVWIDPNGSGSDDVDLWGAPDCCMKNGGGTFLGTACVAGLDPNQLINFAVDTGDRVAVRARCGACNTNSTADYDDMFAGNECN